MKLVGGGQSNCCCQLVGENRWQPRAGISPCSIKEIHRLIQFRHFQFKKNHLHSIHGPFSRLLMLVDPRVFILILPFFCFGSCAASQPLRVEWRDVNLWMWDPGVDRSMTRSIHHRSTQEKPHKKRKILCFEEACSPKKVGPVFFFVGRNWGKPFHSRKAFLLWN